MANCQLPIALWDGVAVDKPGSTSRVVQYRLERAATVCHIRTPRCGAAEVEHVSFEVTVLPQPADTEAAVYDPGAGSLRPDEFRQCGGGYARQDYGFRGEVRRGSQALWQGYLQLQNLNEPGALNVLVVFTDGRPTAFTGRVTSAEIKVAACANSGAKTGFLAAYFNNQENPSDGAGILRPNDALAPLGCPPFPPWPCERQGRVLQSGNCRISRTRVVAT
jgi:hypothetical protein